MTTTDEYYSLKQDENGEWYIDLSDCSKNALHSIMQCNDKHQVYCRLYGSPITHLGEYEELFGFTQNRIKLLNTIKKLLNYYTTEQVVEFLDNACKTAENLGRKSEGEQMKPHISKEEWLLKETLIQYVPNADGKPTPQPAKGFDQQDIYDKLALLEGMAYADNVVLMPAKVEDIAYVLTQDKNNQLHLEVGKIKNLKYETSAQRWSAWIINFSSNEAHWFELGVTAFLDVEEAFKEYESYNNKEQK